MKILKTLVFFFIVSVFFPIASLAQDEGSEPIIQVYYMGQDSFSSLIAGGIGTGYIVYYLPENDPQHPSLVVKLIHPSVETKALAMVFDVPPGEMYVPIRFANGVPSLPETLHPTIIMTSETGWWVRDAITNYNLDIVVYGQVQAMWGADINGGWPTLIDHTTPNTHIIIDDIGNDGLPDYDWRTMLPEFPNRAYIKTNYAEKKCASPIRIDKGIFPDWPFVAFSGGFEQEVGEMRPPIVVDWKAGKIQFFSEVVTVRRQNCSYSFYSINRVLPEEFNHPNFETPFAFYDLSLQGEGYPNLILRTERYVTNDSTVFLKNNREIQSIRYSWRNEIGDWRWDYKVDVLGQFRFDSKTPIAEGMAFIDAPSYKNYPQWVLNRSWPAASFVATEGFGGKSSEGIYEWSMLGLGKDYFFGWQSEPNLAYLDDIRTGFRGEYRLNSDKPPELYFSPIDNRLHLKWAEQGVWRLDDEQIIRVINLNHDEIIDVWSREMKKVAVEDDKNGQTELNQSASKTGASAMSENSENRASSPVVIEALYALNKNFLYHNATEVILATSEYKPILFETLPPADHNTWEDSRAQLASFEDQRRDPTDLRTWLDAFPGPRSEIAGASISHVRFTEGGFRFELSLNSGYRVTGTDFIGIAGLAPGDYVVVNQHGDFTVEPRIPPRLYLTTYSLAEEDGATVLSVSTINESNADATNLTLVVEQMQPDGSVTEVERQSVDVLADEISQVMISLALPSQAEALQLSLEDESGQVLASTRHSLTNSQTQSTSPKQILALSSGQGWQWGVALLLMGISLLMGLAMALAIRFWRDEKAGT